MILEEVAVSFRKIGDDPDCKWEACRIRDLKNGDVFKHALCGNPIDFQALPVHIALCDPYITGWEGTEVWTVEIEDN